MCIRDRHKRSCSDSVLYRRVHRFTNRRARVRACRHIGLSHLRRVADPVAGANLPPSALCGAAGISPRLGGPISTEPLDDESPRDSRQQRFKHLVTTAVGFGGGHRPATRGPSLSRAPRKPQIESVKKIVGSGSFESTVNHLHALRSPRAFAVCGYFHILKQKKAGGFAPLRPYSVCSFAGGTR